MGYSLIVGSKLTVFALFYFVFEGNFPSTRPRGAYFWSSDLTEDFCVTRLGSLYLEGFNFGILGYAIEVWVVVSVVANTILNRFCERAVKYGYTARYPPITDFIRERD